MGKEIETENKGYINEFNTCWSNFETKITSLKSNEDFYSRRVEDRDLINLEMPLKEFKGFLRGDVGSKRVINGVKIEKIKGMKRTLFKISKEFDETKINLELLKGLINEISGFSLINDLIKLRFTGCYPLLLEVNDFKGIIAPIIE